MDVTNRFIRVAAALAVFGAAFAVGLGSEVAENAAERLWIRLRGSYSIEERLTMHGADVGTRVAPRFAASRLAYPPARLALLVFKDRQVLELYGRDTDAEVWKHVTTYPVLAMSGRLGPKLREGDRQVPEGVYAAEFLNANSQFHLSIRLDYPNAFDRGRAKADGRVNLGSDIMIHGSNVSIGCIAVGNEAAEDLFVLAALAGRENVRVLIAPTDFRVRGARVEVKDPPWVDELYERLSVELREYPLL